MIDLDFVRKELKKFDYITFLEEPHIYTYGKDKQFGISTTTFVHSYTRPFDSQKMAPLVAKKNLKIQNNYLLDGLVEDGYNPEQILTLPITTQDVLDKWDYDREFACDKGTDTHMFNEYKWSNRIHDYNKQFYVNKYGEDILNPIWDKLTKICDKWYEDFHERLIVLGLELVVGSKYYDIAGSIDFLAYSKKLDKIILLDYKTNKSLDYKSYYNKRKKEYQYMIKPINALMDCNIEHYSLQLAIYRHILIHETNIPKEWISNDKFLIYVNEKNDNYELHKCRNREKEALTILNERHMKIEEDFLWEK